MFLASSQSRAALVPLRHGGGAALSRVQAILQQPRAPALLPRALPHVRRPPAAAGGGDGRVRQRRLLRERRERGLRQLRRRLPGERQALHPERDRQRRRLHLQAQQLRGDAQRAAVPDRPDAGVPHVPQARVLRRERRPQPPQVPRYAGHRRQVRRVEELDAEMPNVRDRARERGHGDVRAVRGALLRRLQGVVPPGAGPAGEALAERAAEELQDPGRQGARRQVPRARGGGAEYVLFGVQDRGLSGVLDGFQTRFA